MALDFTTVHNFLHGTETVTLDYADPAVTSVSVAKALGQNVQIQDSNGTWVLSSTNKTWCLPGAGLATDPKNGDAVQQASGSSWKILDATKQDLTGQWVCNTVKER
jgi:hypothetical protein